MERGESAGRVSALFKVISALLGLLVAASVGYAIWIVIRYWGSVSV